MNRLKKRLLWLGAFVVAVLALAGGLWVFVFYSQYGARIAVSQFLGWYNAQIPGTVTVQQVDGVIGEGVTLRNIEGKSAHGRIVLRAGKLFFQLSPRLLWEKQVLLESVRVSEVTLTSEEGQSDGGLADLAIPKKDADAPSTDRLLPDLPVHLIAKTVGLDHIRFQKKGAQNTLVNLRVDSVRGAVDWHEQLRVTVAALLGDVAIAGRRFDFSLEESQQIRLRNDRLHTVLVVKNQWGQARFSLDSLLEHSLQAALSFQLKIDALSKALGKNRLPDQLDGKLTGKGHVSFRMGSDETPIIDASFQGTHSSGTKIGDVAFYIDAGLKGNDGSVAVRVEGNGLRIQGAYEGDIDGAGKGTLDVAGKMSSQLLNAFGIQGSAESVKGSAKCRTGGRIACDSTVQFKSVTYEDIQAQNVSARFTARTSDGRADGRSNISGEIEINRMVSLNRSFERIRFSGDYDGEGAMLIVDAAEDARQKARVEARFDFTDGITAYVASLNSGLFGVQLASLNSFGVRFDGDHIKTVSPVSLRLNDAVVTVRRFEKTTDSLSGEASFEQLPLERFSKLAGEPLSGLVNGHVRISGKMSNPLLSLELVASDPSVRSLSTGELRLSGELKDRQLAFTLSGQRDTENVIELDGRIPVAMNLERGELRLPESKTARIHWRVHQFNDPLLRDWIALPDGLTFAVNGHGEFTHINSQMNLTGDISGKVTHPKTGTVEFQLTHSLHPNEQSVQLQMTDKNGMPISAAVHSELPLAKLLQNQIPRGPVNVKAVIDESPLELVARPIDADRVLLELTFGKFDLSQIGKYTDKFVLDGVLSGNLKLVWDVADKSVAPWTASPWHLGLQLRHLTPNTLSGLNIDTGALLFEAAFDGALLCDGKSISANGVLDGWLGDGTFIRFPAHLKFDAAQTAQYLEAEWLMPNGVPAKLELSSTFDLLSYSNGRFAPHSWQAALFWGDASLSLQATIQDLQNGVANIEMHGLSPKLLKPMVSYEGIAGTLSGTATVALENAILSVDSTLRVSEGEVYGWKFKDITTQGVLRNEGLNVRVNGSHQYGADFHVDADIPLAVDTASWRVQWSADKPHRLAWRIPPVNLYPVRQLLGIADIFDISMGTEGVLSGVPNDFAATSKILGTVRAPGIGPIALRGDLKAGPAKQEIALSVFQDSKNSSRLSAALSANIEELITGKQLWEDIPVDASLQTESIDLHFLELFPIPVVSRLGGNVKADLRIDGEMGAPRLTGRMTLADGRFSVAGLANRIHGVNGEIRFYGRRLSVPKLQFKSARGTGRFWGRLRLEKTTLTGSGTLRMNGFPVAMAGLPRFIIDTESSMAFSLDPNLLDMSVNVGRATFTKLAENRNAVQLIPSNSNVTVRDSAQAEGDEKQAFDYDIRIQSDEPIEVKGKDINTRWNTTILANRFDGVATVGGNIDAVGGTFSLFQNTFDIQRGELTLAKTPGKGAYLQLESSSNISSYTVYLNVNGNLLRPKLRLSSSPVLTEEQILTLLVSGSTEEDAEASTGAVTNLLAVQYPGIHNLLYNKFGISQLRVETTDQGSTALKAGKRVTDRSTVYTVVNSNPAKNENDLELQVEVDLSNKTSVGTAVGEKSSSIGIYRRFIIPNKKRKTLKLPFRRRKKK